MSPRMIRAVSSRGEVYDPRHVGCTNESWPTSRTVANAPPAREVSRARFRRSLALLRPAQPVSRRRFAGDGAEDARHVLHAREAALAGDLFDRQFAHRQEVFHLRESHALDLLM